MIHLCPHALPETIKAGSHGREVFAPMAKAVGLNVDEMAEKMLAEGNDAAMLRRFPTLAEVAETPAFMASDHAGAMTATTANLTCGALVS